jgi:DNA polymerase-3 subunit gamma/tau
MGEKSPILAKHLSFSSSHATFGPNSLVIRFPSCYADAREACAAEAGTQRIVDALRRVTGQLIAVKFEVDTSAAARATISAASASATLAPTDRKKSLAALPLFKKAGEALGAQIWHVDDDFNPLAPPQAKRNKDQGSEANTDEE